MSPTSYQTAPPRDLMIATRGSRGQTSAASSLQLRPLAGIHNFRWINGGVVYLLFENSSIFADQEIYPTRCFVLVNVKAVFTGGLATQSLSSGKVTPIESATRTATTW